MNRFVKRGAFVLALMMVSMVAAACGGGGGAASNTPEAATKAWFEGAFASNTDAVKTNSCAASQETVDEAIAGFSAMGGQAGATLDASGLTFTKATESGDDATVTVGGVLKVTVAGTTVDQPMDGAFPAIPLKKEGGAWKVCGL